MLENFFDKNLSLKRKILNAILLVMIVLCVSALSIIFTLLLGDTTMDAKAAGMVLNILVGVVLFVGIFLFFGIGIYNSIKDWRNK